MTIGERRSRFIDVRTLAAVDMALHGTRFIVAEFAAGVLLCGAIGAYSLWLGLLTRPGGPAPFATLLGIIMVGAALNYVPLLLYAVALARHGNIRAVAGVDAADLPRQARRYGAQSLLILVPLAVVVLALAQERQRRSTRTQ